MQNEPTDPQAELREQVAKIIAESDSIGEGYSYVDVFEDLDSLSKEAYYWVVDTQIMPLIDQLLTTVRERVIGEARWEGISNKALLDEKWKKYQGNLTYYDFCLQELEALKKGTDAK